MNSLPFTEKLAEAVKQNDSLLCVGLDPDPSLMPIASVADFNKAIIEATSDLVCCYKPNIAFYEALGAEGMEALHMTMRNIPDHIPVILDAKRGDIGNTSAAYARAVFDELGADAMTVNPWGGKDAVEPFYEYADKGIIVWCRSSNPSAGDFQDQIVEYEGVKRPLWQVVALKSMEWNIHGNIGIVMGATYPEQLKQARQICPTMPILIPGVGAQDGSLRESVLAGVTAAGDGAIISASRGVLYASRAADYALAARAAATTLRYQINQCRPKPVVIRPGEE
ncbi:MAG: orotidine-5'-phosphate decarboxylase [Dehalococcoidia bacterium]